MKILIVDDHSLFRKATIALYNTSLIPNVEFLQASNGLEAWEIVNSAMIDIVLLDIQMPVMDGIAFLKKVKGSLLKLGIIVLTQFDNPALISHCIQLGANSFLQKNSEPDEVIEAIERVVAGSFYFSPRVHGILTQQLNGTKIFANLDITPRELQVLALLAEGQTTNSIASKLGLSAQTVNDYRKSLISKTKVSNVAELVSLGYKTGILVG